MPRFCSTVVLAATVACAAAQEVVNVFLLNVDQQPLVASVIGGDASATTMFVQCRPGTDGSDCGFPNGATVTVGPSTFHGTYSDQVEGVTAIPDCKLTGSPSVTSAYCEQTMIGPQDFLEAPGPDVTVTTGTATSISTSTASVSFGPTDVASFYVSITITAGKVGQTGGSSSGSAAATMASISGSQSVTGSLSGSAAGSATASGAASSFTGSGNAGAVKPAGLSAVAGLIGMFLALF